MGNVMKKLIVGLVVGGVLFGVTRALEFPNGLPADVRRLCDPWHCRLPLARCAVAQALERRKSIGRSLVVFYIVLCVAYIAGASMWPQYDPEDEKGKIDKILKPKRAATEQGKAEELIARVKALDDQAKALAARIKALGGDQAPGQDFRRTGCAPRRPALPAETL